MRCITCGAESLPDTSTDVTELKECMVIVRNVPCHKCVECTEIMYTADVVKKLETITAQASSSLNEIAITNFDIKVA